MKLKKKCLVLVALLGLSFPIQTQAATQDQDSTAVTIGFRKQRNPDQITININRYNVLPSTGGGRIVYQTQDTSRGTLPKTGEPTTYGLQLLGIGCLMSSFWLFLFLRLKKEGEYE